MSKHNIKRVQSGKFRFTIYAEDIIQPDEVLSITVEKRGLAVEEVVALFHGIPFQFPSVGRFYRNKITREDTTNVLEIVKRLQYINKEMNQSSVDRMVMYIVTTLTATDDSGTPVISVEEMQDMVNHCIVEPDIELTMEHRSILYSKKSRMDREDKWRFTYESNRAAMSKHLGKAIHYAALNAIHITHPLLKVTDSRVLKELNSEAITTVRTMKRHIEVNTVDRLKEENVKRPLNHKKSLDKYQKFIDDPANSEKSTTELAAKLSMSRSTIVKFRELKGRNILEEPRESYV